MSISHEDILSFWFGIGSSNDINKLRKDLWFVGENEIEKRNNVDELIKQRFATFHQSVVNGNILWKNGNARERLAIVIVLDQFTRHIYRGNDLVIQQCTDVAVTIAKESIELHFDMHLRSSEFCFLVMPLRHKILYCKDAKESFELQNLLQKSIDNREEDDRAHNTILERFNTAMDRRKMSIGDLAARQFTDAEILENVDYSPKRSLEDLAAHPVYKTVLKFLLEKLTELSNYRMHPPTNEVQLSYKLFVSLSGGVDSMVLGFILSHIVSTNALLIQSSGSKEISQQNAMYKKINKRPKTTDGHMAPSRVLYVQNLKLNIDIEAVHIDYANREESAAEATFVEKWCKLYNIKFFKTRIDHIRRGVTARDEYEQLSRKIRYQAYKDRQFPGCTGMMFGHHRGDIQENVLSNSMKGCSIMEISGMTAESVNDGVRVWRPLLGHDKKDIFDVAHTFGVPYFKDTTPRWSTRGKLRNRLWPALAATYGEGFGLPLLNLANQSDQLHEFLNEHIFNPFRARIVDGMLAAAIPLDGYMDFPSFFWKHAMREVCHSFSYSMIKEKPMELFVNTVNGRQFTTKTGSNCVWLPLKHENKTLIFVEQERKTLLLFHDKVTLERIERFEIKLGETQRHGNFSVSVSSEPPDEVYARDHFDMLSWVKLGELVYTVPVASSYVLCPKFGRFLSYFRNVDRRIREALPIITSDSKDDAKHYVKIAYCL